MIDSTAIERARAVRIEDELARRGIKLNGRIERAGPCPRCGGTDRFSVNTKENIWNCRQCKKKRDPTGDVIGLVQLLDECSFAEAIETLTGEAPRKINHAPRAQPRRHDDDERRMLSFAERVWSETGELPPFVVDWIAERRGILIDDVPERGGLRWHPKCPWKAAAKPCIVARFTDAVTNEPRGIWRRPLTGEKPMTLGPMGGRVIRLWPDDMVAQGVVLGEGVETTLAAATRIQHNGTLLQPAWASGCAGNMGAFPVLPGIEALTILVDNDASGTGQRSADECARRWLTAGREVELLTPKNLGSDFNNLTSARSGARL